MIDLENGALTGRRARGGIEYRNTLYTAEVEEMISKSNVLTPALLRISEAAQIAGCGRSKAYELSASGAWPTVETPYGRRVVYAGLLEWLERLQEGR